MADPKRPEPPYKKEDINETMSPEEQRRALAEMHSYIARLKRMDREAAERTAAFEAARAAQEAQTSQPSDGPSSYSSGVPSSPFRNPTGFGPQRGGYARGRGLYSGYHPYSRPTPRFKNNSVVFSQSGSTDETLRSKKESTPTTNTTPLDTLNQNQQEALPQMLCPNFTQTGICSRHGCRHLHDPEKLAVCKRWLFKGMCPMGDSCALSHHPSPHNAPTCQHFQNGNCNNENCRFAHIRLNPAAQNCNAFGQLGYCEDGAKCPELHAHECPTFTNTGSCRFGDKCRLGHVYRASRMRKALSHSPESHSSPSDSTKDMDDHTDAESYVSGDEAKAAQNHHQFTQQADFVSLDYDD